MDRRTFLSTVTALTGASFAGCLGDGSAGQSTDTSSGTTSAPTNGPTGPASPSSTPVSVGQQEYPEYEWMQLKGESRKFTDTIELRNTAFHPLVAEVPMGRPVRFVNQDSSGHSVTIPALDIDRQLSEGDSVSLTFSEGGTYDYVCRFHPPAMLGRLVISNVTPVETEIPTTTGGSGSGETTTPDGTPGYY